MVVKTPKDLEKLQEKLREQFAPYLQPRDDETSRPDQDPQVLIREARASLETAIRDRDEGLRMADLRIERRRKELASLESNLRLAEPPTDVAGKKRTLKARKAVRKGR